MLRRIGGLVAGAFAMALAGGEVANADHLNFVGPIDAIDGVFASGGGSFGPIGLGAGGSDWYAFAGNAGDPIVIDVSAGGGTDSVVALFQAVTNGVVEVGDDPQCANTISVLDCGGQGAGHDLLWLAYNDDFAGLSSHLALALPASGQYAILVQGFNKDSPLTYTVTLSGNTAAINQVPEPGTLALFGVGLAALRLRRRRFA